MVYSVQCTLYTVHCSTIDSVQYCAVYSVHHCTVYSVDGGGLRRCQPLTQVTALTSQEIATYVNTQGAWVWQQGMLDTIVKY